jgi:hypothetical protein
MTAGTNTLGQSFYIDSVPRVITTPHSKSTWNEFDEHGLLLGLARLPEEKNWEYRRRLFDVFAHRANSSYRGLVHGITRELGLELLNPIAINPKVDINGNFLATDPFIKFDGVYVYLYSDYANELLDYKIDRWDAGGNYEHLGRFVDLINTTSFFEASFNPVGDPWVPTMTILNQSNRIKVKVETIPASNRFKLAHEHVVAESITFSNISNYRLEVSNSSDVITNGRYWIDYRKGIVYSYGIPDIGTSISYEYIGYPFQPLASPIVLADINNDNFKVKMFQQILLDDGTYTNGLPTELGVDFINELYSVYSSLWGL